jgi:hypothetical protein
MSRRSSAYPKLALSVALTTPPLVSETSTQAPKRVPVGKNVHPHAAAGVALTNAPTPAVGTAAAARIATRKRTPWDRREPRPQGHCHGPGTDRGPSRVVVASSRLLSRIDSDQGNCRSHSAVEAAPLCPPNRGLEGAIASCFHPRATTNIDELRSVPRNVHTVGSAPAVADHADTTEGKDRHFSWKRCEPIGFLGPQRCFGTWCGTIGWHRPSFSSREKRSRPRGSLGPFPSTQTDRCRNPAPVCGDAQATAACSL